MTRRRTCALVVGTFACVLIALTVQIAAAQQTSAPQPQGDDRSKLPVSLDRIREGLQRDPQLKIDFLDPSIPLFRVHVRENAIELEDYWKVGPDTAVSRDVRPSHASRWHHEFLSMVTPKEYLATAPMMANPIHPVGAPILPIASAIKTVMRNSERKRIRRQIQEELKQIEANQAAQQQQQTPVPKDPR